MARAVWVTEEAVPGWAAPVFSGMADPPMFHGVPLAFFVANLLGTLLVASLLAVIEPVWSGLAVLGGVGLYGLVLLGTTLEPRWPGILSAYLAYDVDYEG